MNSEACVGEVGVGEARNDGGMRITRCYQGMVCWQCLLTFKSHVYYKIASLHRHRQK